VRGGVGGGGGGFWGWGFFPCPFSLRSLSPGSSYLITHLASLILPVAEGFLLVPFFLGAAGLFFCTILSVFGTETFLNETGFSVDLELCLPF